MQILKSTKTELKNDIKLIGKETSKNRPLIIGVFHGDEPQGKLLIEKYLENFDGEMLFIPCLNPDGMTLNKRTNANNVDLNRNFPTQNWGQDGSAAGKNASDYFGGKSPASEVETKFVIEIIEEFKPSIILTLHAPYKIVNYDGPAKEIAEKISNIINYPVEKNIGYPTPGSFGTYVGIERNIPTLTLELDEICPIEDLISPVHKIFDLLNIIP